MGVKVPLIASWHYILISASKEKEDQSVKLEQATLLTLWNAEEEKEEFIFYQCRL